MNAPADAGAAPIPRLPLPRARSLHATVLVTPGALLVAEPTGRSPVPRDVPMRDLVAEMRGTVRS